MKANQPLPRYTLWYAETSLLTGITFPGLAAIASELKDGYAVLWQHHGVFVRSIEGSAVNWQPNEPIETDMYEHLVRLRAFASNGACEYHFWRRSPPGNETKQTPLVGRRRSDGNMIATRDVKKKSPEEQKRFTAFVDTEMELRGVVAKQLVALQNGGETPEKKSRLFIKTRNYIGYNEIGQAGYVDSRFVQFNKK